MNQPEPIFVVIANKLVNLAECIHVSQDDKHLFFMTSERRDFAISFSSPANAATAHRQLLATMQEKGLIRFTIAG